MKKTTYFCLLFLFIGIIIGGTGVYLYYYNSFSELQKLSSLPPAPLSSKEDLTENKQEMHVKKEEQFISENSEMILADNGKESFSGKDSVETYSQIFPEEKTEVIHDELVKVLYLELPVRNSNKQDSLLINDKTKEIINLTVEFWISPLNYSGYQMNRSKLILFGVKQPEKASFEIQEQGKILLKYKESYILLEPTDDFRPLKLNNK